MKNTKLYAWVLRGKQRKAIIRVMDRTKMPSEIRRDAIQFNNKISLNNTSDILREFRKKKIAICLNPEERIGRLYELTKKGKEIREEILKGSFEEKE